MRTTSAIARAVKAAFGQRHEQRIERVLVVDDEPQVCAFIARVLRQAGYLVDTASGGAEGLATVAAGKVYDLVVADVRMPGMTGPDMIEQMRRAGSAAKTLYLTGYADQLFQARDALLWADEAFLEKPSSIRGIEQAVALLLHGHIDTAPSPPA